MWLPISCSLQLAYGCILDYLNRIYFFTQSQLIANQVQTRLRKPINQFLIDIVIPVSLIVLTACLSMIGYNYNEILSQPIYSAMSNVRQKDYCILNFIEESDPEFNEVKTLFNDKTFQILNLTCNYFLPSSSLLWLKPLRNANKNKKVSDYVVSCPFHFVIFSIDTFA